MRGLRVYRAIASTDPPRGPETGDDLFDPRVHARSRFRSHDDPDRFAVYTVHETDAWAPSVPVSDPGDHTLIVVREFRRVPLHASALVMLLLTARPGYSAAVLAALALFVERAVSAYQPAYLLLAHSLEQPQVSALMMGVHECTALAAACPAAFSVDTLLPELETLLLLRPEWFSYCPEPAAQSLTSRLVSPYAV
jgi:hypothetical protein